jgi:hypothetical protein
MKINIIRERMIKGTAGGSSVELLMEVDDELLEAYQSETGDYEDPPQQKTLDEWLNSLITSALEEDWNWRG